MPTAADKLEKRIEALFDAKPARYTEDDRDLFRVFKQELNAGRIRSAEPDAMQSTGWRTNAWVKKGILVGFRMGAVVDMSIDPAKQPFFDKDTYPPRHFSAADAHAVNAQRWPRSPTSARGLCQSSVAAAAWRC